MNSTTITADDGLLPPIFLLGNVRSGTSMMHDLFDLHPKVKSWYEPRTVWVYADPGRTHDRFDEADATPKAIRYIRGRFLRYQREHDGRRIMEKTPSNLLRIPYVRTIFPESKYVYIVRHPFSYLSSSELKWRKPISWRHVMTRFREVPKSQLHYHLARGFIDHFRKKVLKRKHVSVWGVRYAGVYEDLHTLTVEEVICKQWVACSRQARADLEGLGEDTVLHFRYEDFVTDPVTHFRRILAHFDLETTIEIEDELRRRVDPNRRSKWKRLDPDVLKRCIPILKDEMERHGYTIPPEVLASPSSSSDPSSDRGADNP